ncbi:MAG: hypothetical protein RIS52_28, partial [Pseudomonadota bacterium]|jgi:uncharacterized protein (TIGR02217 family)
MTARLGYPVAAQHYFSGFVLVPQDHAQWGLIDAAAEAARGRGVGEVFIWALPQIVRDGYTHFSEGEAPVNAFDDLLFPLSLGRDAQVSPSFSTAIVTTASGSEQRNAAWAQGRMRYDAGTGIRSDADLKALIAFFRARRGAAKGFRFRDPLDHDAVDQLIGIGDGVRTSFALVKRYGTGADAEVRRITRPEAASVIIMIDGTAQATGWSLLELGDIGFSVPPAAGALITAHFAFDVPVRFAVDQLDIDAITFAAGDAPHVPLIEVREGVA